MSFARVPFFIELIARALETFSLLVPGKELIREISDGGFDWRIRISRSRIQERYIYVRSQRDKYMLDFPVDEDKA